MQGSLALSSVAIAALNVFPYCLFLLKIVHKVGYVKATCSYPANR